MIRSTIKKIASEVNGERLYTNVYDVAGYHRIQVSTGYREAANYCCNKLKQMGIQSEILSYPSDGKAAYLGSYSFKEWDCRAARCDLVAPYPMTLADFSGDPISIIQRSAPCDYSNTPLEIVWMNKGCEPAAYADVELTGKLLFVREDFTDFNWAIAQRGALGFITDFVATGATRSREDLVDIKKYTSFWYKGDTATQTAFGFALSPRMGNRLQSICQELSKVGQCPKATCFVQSSLYDGAIEVVSGFLPGEIDEEVLITAHLCHPRASANDNASGVSAAMEALNVIKTMIDQGRLAPLKRGIRILLVPEFAGTFAYFDRLGEDKKKVLAGINLDMIGGRQSGGYGPITITSLPFSTPSFVGDVATLILDQLRQDVPALSHIMVPMFNSTTTDFVGGSDHMILCDPLVGIPAPMLGQFPDLNYHTSGDTIAVIDPYILHKSCSLATSYVYCLATITADDLPEIFNMMNNNLSKKLGVIIDTALSVGLVGTIKEHFAHILTFYQEGCDKIAEFIPNCAAIPIQKERLSAIAQAILTGYEDLGVPQSKWIYKDFVPTKSFAGLLDRVEAHAKTTEQKNALQALNQYCALHDLHLGCPLLSFTGFYLDGKRPLSEIARLSVLDSGVDNKEAIQKFIDTLMLLGLVQ